MEEKYVQVSEILHRISDLRISRDDFDESYCEEHERLLQRMVESTNTTIQECIKIIDRISKDEKFTITCTKE